VDAKVYEAFSVSVMLGGIEALELSVAAGERKQVVPSTAAILRPVTRMELN